MRIASVEKKTSQSAAPRLRDVIGGDEQALDGQGTGMERHLGGASATAVSYQVCCSDRSSRRLPRGSRARIIDTFPRA
jgi:hypothetical protein